MSDFDNNEEAVTSAFSSQAPVFDGLYQHNSIIGYKRERVRKHVERYLQPNSNILELNSGTGEDAIYFAQQGHTVKATDISTGMQQVAKEKIDRLLLGDKLTYELCSFTNLESLKKEGLYDHIFSNFAGLNCTDNLESVVNSFERLLQPGGYVTMVIMPGFCLWESLLLLKGKFETATRRWFTGKGAIAHIEGHYFTCTYYSAGTVKKYMGPKYELISLEGLCTIVPPSYIENFAEKHGNLFSWLKKKEDKYKSRWPWRNMGDYYLITFKKKHI